jgi:hypothetical protein
MKHMKRYEVILTLIAGLFFTTACSEQESVSGLFSGTLSTMEIERNGEKIMTNPKSLFITFMDDALEYEGELYQMEIVGNEDNTLQFQTNLLLGGGLSVSMITFSKESQQLILEVSETGRKVEMEPYDRMMSRKAEEFAAVDLTADISHLSDNQKKMLGLLFQVADIMEEIYWAQVFPDKDAVLGTMVNEDVKRFFRINYGPWERLNGNLPFIPGYGPKPAGSGYYPEDMTLEEFEAMDDPSKTDLYTLIQRNAGGNLVSVPYHEAYSDQVQQAASLLQEAAELAEDEGFKKYLSLRAEALLTDDYFPSDMAWMEMKENDIDFVVGPIENYEDALFNYKAAHESFILIKDKAWSQRLEYISSVLPDMQKSLPVPERYKQEMPGSDNDLGAYDVVYYAGDCNAGSKTIAINLPNDERVQAVKGSRKLQLQNAIRYKFEEILVPISNVLIDESQREHVTFEAFFENTMYHEVAHGLGLNHTVNGSGTVREALRDQYSALEEGKADILSLFLITKMYEDGLLGERDLMDNYVTFMASIFRSIRFGVASSHGKANMIRFYYFQEEGAFTRDPENGTYRINFQEMQQAMTSLANRILTIQGDGNYQSAVQLVEEKGFIRGALQNDLDRLKQLNIPVDIVFNQGPEVLGL